VIWKKNRKKRHKSHNFLIVPWSVLANVDVQYRSYTQRSWGKIFLGSPCVQSALFFVRNYKEEGLQLKFRGRLQLASSVEDVD
jgi:hypothetical protein